MRSAAQIENSVKKAKKLHKQYQHMYCERWQAHDVTSDQVHGHSTSNVVRKRLIRNCYGTATASVAMPYLTHIIQILYRFFNSCFLRYLNFIFYRHYGYCLQ